ncbi:uncharacterized protein LOC114354806 [Ostrinia furnacalis]|uniref:uncharacterized protein LOC114354806 n=1 Tax=Ostrinia furnacalis TaxID=93504 RepID=UPI001039B122|nr:uncharacterized protein LOC114354806 [Ostrinia furnacalis]
MQRTPEPEHQVKYSSYPNLTIEPEAGNSFVRNINLRKRKTNPEETQFEEMKSALMESFKEMMNSEMAEIKNQNLKILETNNEMIKLLQINATSYKEITGRVEALETKHETAMKRISDLEAQLNSIQKKMNSNMVEIRNVPRADGEDLKEIVTNICTSIKTQPINNANIYRRGKNNAPIIIEYKESKERDILLKAFKKYNGDNKDNPLNTESVGYALNNVYDHRVIGRYKSRRRLDWGECVRGAAGSSCSKTVDGS